MPEVYINAGQSTLNGSIDNSQTSLVVTSASTFPAAGTFRCLISAEGANTNEIVTVTAVSGTTFTIIRASEAYAGSSSASAHASGATITQVLTTEGLHQNVSWNDQLWLLTRYR